MRRICSSLAAVLIAFAATGCSSEKQRQIVTGTVTHEGKPLPLCSVQFHGPDGLLTTAPVQPDGSFSMTDVFPGEYKASIHIRVEKKKGYVPPPTPPIPAKYLNESTSGLVYTITPGTRSITIELK
jgi:hypothetical protein